MHYCMDWRSVKFDWNRARAFLVTAEEGSLSAASRALGMTQPTLGRQVSALEKELGIVLFERVGRGLTLTPSGLELLDHTRAMGEAASRISLTASGQSQSIQGSVCISASEVDAAFRLPPIIAKLRHLQPGIDIEIVASNAESDLRRREADIAIRNYRPKQPSLIARKLRDIDGRLYASGKYLETLGYPEYPEGFANADFIGFDRSEQLIEALKLFGLSLTQRNFPIVSTSHLIQWEHVKQGAGIGIMSQDIGDKEPQVQQVLPQLDPLVVPVWLVCHREVHTSRRVRLVFDLLAQELLSF
ncbi:MAG: LysR family transcriptional regulator [Marinosulfonomonas sp.]|nr:LysR family transcriptional regulator [Marinosulfonomonas sp.]